MNVDAPPLTRTRVAQYLGGSFVGGLLLAVLVAITGAVHDTLTERETRVSLWMDDDMEGEQT